MRLFYNICRVVSIIDHPALNMAIIMTITTTIVITIILTIILTIIITLPPLQLCGHMLTKGLAPTLPGSLQVFVIFVRLAALSIFLICISFHFSSSWHLHALNVIIIFFLLLLHWGRILYIQSWGTGWSLSKSEAQINFD